MLSSSSELLVPAPIPLDSITQTAPIRAGMVAATTEGSTAATFNVRDFGAKGDGITDDTQAIQTAINSSVGNVLYIPAGTYIVSKSGPTTVLILPSNIEIAGDGYGKTILKLQAGQPDFTPVLRGVQATNIGLRDLTVDGNKAMQLSSTAEHSPDVWLENSSTVRLTRVELKNAQGDGVLIRGGSQDVLISDSRITDNFREAVALGTGYRNITITGSYLEGPIHSEPEQDVLNEGVTITNNTIKAPQWAISIGGNSINGVTKNWVVRGNVINGGIIIVRAEDVLITENIITGPTITGTAARATIYGIYHSRNVQITANTIQGQVLDVIYLGAVNGEIPMYWTITGNKVIVPMGRKAIVNKGGQFIVFRANAIIYA